MARVVRPVGHEDRLSVVDHLDELRSRLMICAIAVIIAFAACFVENQPLLHLLNKPLPSSVKNEANHLAGITHDSVNAAHYLGKLADSLGALATAPGTSQQQQPLFNSAANYARRASKSLPQTTPSDLPITIGVGEPFTTTLTVCFYFALLFSLPILLYQAYAFVIPALSPRERRLAVPIMIGSPVLFVTGVVFTYLVILPAAIKFLQGYNSGDFQALVQAKPLYSFEVLTMAAVGLAFQLPIGLLGLQRAGVINGSTLTRHWRYATVIIAIIAAAMPGADPVTTGLETLPLVILFLASIVMLKIADRRDAARALAELTTVDDET
jgi:sec-independent protein translocase protein TatC